MVAGQAFWHGRPTLVTGASGLLGGWLVDHLLRAGAQVVALVHRSELRLDDLDADDGHAEHTGRLIPVHGDVADGESLADLLSRHDIRTVFHLAAQSLVGVAQGDPLPTFETNVRGTWCLLDACRRVTSVEQIVVASSDKAYGEPEQLPARENTPLAGRHPYDVSKSCADLLSQAYAATYGMAVGITRCANYFGGGDLHWSRLVPGTIRAVLLDQQPALRSDGLAVRDYLYVKDGATAAMHLAEALAQRPALSGQAFNFSCGVRLTALELVDLILELMGSDARPCVEDIASSEIRCQYLSCARAEEELGWQPSFTLREGLKETIRWYRRHFAHAH